MSLPSRIYKPLGGPADIRLLVLKSGKENEPINCILLNPMSLDSLGSLEPSGDNTNILLQAYHALSYVWGDQNDPRLIILNWQPFRVTRNLYSALRRLRAIGYDNLLLWVDAICIDQTNISEREAQVKLMSRIYRQAKAVIADVGEQTDVAQNFDPLLDSIIDAGETCDAVAMSLEDSPNNALVEEQSLRKTIAKIVQTTPEGSSVSNTELDEAANEAEPTVLRLEHYGMPPKHDNAWIPFRRFFVSPYFRRVWILQEFALARRISMLYGDIQILASKLFDAMRYLAHYGTGTLDSYFAVYTNVDEMRRLSFGAMGFKGFITLLNEKEAVLQKLAESDERSLLIHKLNLSRHHLATDPRDKIYALLGLASDSKFYSGNVDYSQPYETVYRNFGRLFIKHGHGIELLYQAGIYSDWSKLPSWNPDWAKTDVSLSRIVEVGQESDFAAAVLPPSTIEIQNDDKTLKLKGVIVDAIVQKTDFLGSDTLLSDDPRSARPGGGATLSEILHFFVDGMAFAQKLSDYPTKEEYLEVFLRTFIRGPPTKITKNHMLSLMDGVRAIFARGMLGKSLHEKEGPPLEELLVQVQKGEDQMSELLKAGAHQALKRCFCITAKGYFGLVPGKVTNGDQVAILNGAPVPFILREAERDSSAEPAYRLVGDGYFHGLMHGEASSLDTHQEREIALV